METQDYWGKIEAQGYWIGPHEMRVPNKITAVLADDCCNTLYNDGSSTEKCSNILPLTKEEYLTEYAEKRDDGFYWYKTQWYNDNESSNLEPSENYVCNSKKIAFYQPTDPSLPLTKEDQERVYGLGPATWGPGTWNILKSYFETCKDDDDEFKNKKPDINQATPVSQNETRSWGKANHQML